MTNDNALFIATEMRTALAALPGWTVGELLQDATGCSFDVSVPSFRDRSGKAITASKHTRHIANDGTLTVTRHG